MKDSTKGSLITLALMALWLFAIYSGIAFAVFQWRNPLANKMSFWRDFGAVMRYEKLQKYQPRE